MYSVFGSSSKFRIFVFVFFRQAYLKKIKTNIRNSKLSNRSATKDIGLPNSAFSWTFWIVYSIIYSTNEKNILMKISLLTVPNNSYRFWADLLHKWSFKGMTDIHEYWSKLPCLPIILINFPRAATSNIFFIMKKSKFT